MSKTTKVISAVMMVLCMLLSAEGQDQKLQVLFSDPAKNLVARGVDTTNIADIVQMIDSSNTYFSKSAALYLASRGFGGATQRIKTRFLSAFNDGWHSPTDLADYLVSLYLLGAPETQQLSTDFLDTLAARRNRGWYFPSEVASVILRVKLNLGDYSQFPMLGIVIQESLNNSYPIDLHLILAYARKSELRRSVFSYVTSLADNSNARIRKEAIFLFSYFADIPETRDVLQSIATMDNSTEIRLDASALLASLFSDPIAVTVDQQVATSTADTATFARAIIEMCRIRSPLGLKALQNTQASLSPGYFLDLVSLRISSYEPPRPSMDLTLSLLLDSLRSFLRQVAALGWLADANFSTELTDNIVSAMEFLRQGDSAACAGRVMAFQRQVDIAYKDSLNSDPRRVTIEGWKFLYYNAQYILDRLPQIPPAPGIAVKFVNSSGTRLTSGSLQYYDGTWKDATNNSDGTFSVNTTLTSVSLRMTYEGGSQQKNNVPVGPDTVVFQTVNTQVKLQSNQGALIDTGAVQYYAGSWRMLGTTSNGVATKELLPVSYSFRMTYAYGSNDKQQDIGANPVVVFQTTNARVQLQNSLGAFIDQGSVQYYGGAWRNFGTTTNGSVSKELLANNYSFRMTYAYGSNDKQQDIGTNPDVIFATTNATVELRNSQGALIDQGAVQYYAGAWRGFGNTSNGAVSKELLPNSYSFRMTYAFGSNDKLQNIGTNPTLVFTTTNAMVELRNSQGALIDQGTVQYYAGAWRSFGSTSGGTVSKELLPANYSFRMTSEHIPVDKSQNLSTNNTVAFSTVLCTIRVRNTQGQPVNGALASYYSGAWRQIGQTTNGEVTKELLPGNLTFRIVSGGITQDKVQNLGANTLVEFTTQ